jgi:hypothetical protein
LTQPILDAEVTCDGLKIFIDGSPDCGNASREIFSGGLAMMVIAGFMLPVP